MRYGIDGQTRAATYRKNDCCPSDICSISLNEIRCNFISLLPSGPLWDGAKQTAAQDRKKEVCLPQEIGFPLCKSLLCNDEGQDGSCSSMAHIATFIGNQFFNILQNVFWPVIREGNPYTAVTTLDDWLDRLGWIDCYNTTCTRRTTFQLSPLEIMGECGPVYHDPNYPKDYERALKSGIVKALYRMRLGVIPTLDILNFILEPLAAKVVPEWTSPIEEDCPCRWDKICLRLTSADDKLLVPQEQCNNQEHFIPVRFEYPCDMDRPAGLPNCFYPNLMAAECIVRALIPSQKLCIVSD